MKKKGFTLVELMIALSIFAILMGSVYKAYFSELKELRQIADKNNLQYNAKSCIEYITRELRNKKDYSQGVTLEGNGTLIKSYITVNNVETSTILVDVSGSSKGLVNLNKATKKLTDDKGRILCNGVNNISLSKDASGNMIIITIDLQSGNESYSITTGINLSK